MIDAEKRLGRSKDEVIIYVQGVPSLVRINRGKEA